jgi:hypothetical protein
MAIDLEDLVDPLKREMSPPGTDLFSTASDDDWLGQLEDSFWEAKLYGFFHNYTASENFVSPISGTTELPRDQQQLIVLFAGGRCLRNELKNMNTLFHAEAGSVSFETQNSANLLIAVLKDLRSKVDLALAALGEINSTTVAYIDSLYSREDSIYYGDTKWSGAGDGAGVAGYNYGSGWY